MLTHRSLFNHRGHREHGGDCVGTAAFAARMGQSQNKNSASGLARFLLFFCQSQLAGIIRVHPSNPWLVLFQPRRACGLLKATALYIPHALRWVALEDHSVAVQDQSPRPQLTKSPHNKARTGSLTSGLWSGCFAISPHTHQSSLAATINMKNHLCVALSV